MAYNFSQRYRAPMTGDEHVAQYRRQRADALETIGDIDEGRVKHFEFEGDNPIDVTADWRAQKQRDVDMLDRLIDAWGRLNA